MSVSFRVSGLLAWLLLVIAPAHSHGQDQIFGKFYHHQIVGFVTSPGPASIPSTAGPSINDAGTVAFVANTGFAMNSVIVSDLPFTSQRIISTTNQFGYFGGRHYAQQ